jgi:hypothetical protein
MRHTTARSIVDGMLEEPPPAKRTHEEEQEVRIGLGILKAYRKARANGITDPALDEIQDLAVELVKMHRFDKGKTVDVSSGY